MPLFQTADIQRFFEQGEQNISVEQPFLVDRISISVAVNQPTYALPDSAISIRRVTWRGMKLDPLTRRAHREVFQSATQVGRPFWYIYNNIGAQTIQFFPIPGETIGSVTNVWDTDIPNGVIVEYYRVTDFVNFILPVGWRNVLLKKYAAHGLTMMNGAGQKLKLSQYYHDEWALWKTLFYNYLNDLFTKPRKYVVNEIVSNNYYPASPVLPIGRFGPSVDEGY